MAEVIFERFVDHSHQQLADSCDEFPFELELEGPSPEQSRSMRADSVQSSCYPDDTALVSWSGAGRGLAIPRRHTMDTAACSLPAHLTPGWRPAMDGSLPQDPATSPAARRHQPSLPGSSIPSLWSLRSRASSPSPGIRRIPSILRRSLSKLFSSGRVKSRSPPPQLSISRCPSQASIVSQQTEDMVRESLAKGLPIIPFAFPAFHNMPASAPTEEARSAPSRPQTARGAEGHDAPDGYCNMERAAADDGQRPRPKISVTSQSSYVEMTTPSGDTSLWNEDPYVRMDSVFPTASSRHNSSYVDSEPVNVDPKKTQKLRTLLKPKKVLIIGQQYKKGNKHSDEYAFIDFSKNRETVSITDAQLHPFLSL